MRLGKYTQLFLKSWQYTREVSPSRSRVCLLAKHSPTPQWAPHQGPGPSGNESPLQLASCGFLGGVGQRGVLRSQSPLGGQTDLYLSSWRLYLGAPQPKYRGVRQESPRVMGCGSSLCLLSLAKRPDGGTWMHHESLPPVPLHLSWVPNIDDLHPCQENTQSTDQQRQGPAMHTGQVATSLLAFVNVKELGSVKS